MSDDTALRPIVLTRPFDEERDAYSDNETETHFSDDVDRIVREFADAGLLCTREQAIDLWTRHSLDMDAGWLCMDVGRDGSALELLRRRALFVEKGDSMSDDTTIGSGTITETDGLRLRCDHLREQRDQARRWAAAWKAKARRLRAELATEEAEHWHTLFALRKAEAECRRLQRVISGVG